MLVRKAGLEPAWLAPPPPQDGVSANSTTSAFKAGSHRVESSPGAMVLMAYCPDSARASPGHSAQEERVLALQALFASLVVWLPA